MNASEAKRRLQAALAAAHPKAPEPGPLDGILWLIRLPAGHPDEESCRQIAEMFVAKVIGSENPNEPHYPNVYASAMADRYGIDVVKYAVNEKHAEILRRVTQ